MEGMNGKQLERILRSNPHTRQHFLGVFAADNLPHSKKYPHCFVANTDPHYRKGQHWVSIWVQNSHSAEYFCSLGEPPNARLQKYLSIFQWVKVNNRQIQANLEDTCGHYCIYFLVCRAQGQSFPQIMQTLWRTRAMADMLVKFFVRHLIVPTTLST
jgi:hypothetical protein